MVLFRRYLKIILSLTGLGGLLAVLALAWLVRTLPMSADLIDFSIEPGTSVAALSEQIVDSGVQTRPWMLHLMFRASGQARKLRAGSYEISRGTSALQLMRKLVRGDETLLSVTLVEGWNFRQFRQLLNQAQGLRHDSMQLSDQALMQQLGRPGLSAEGHFFPDTYTYGKGSSDLRIFSRALAAMDKQLESAWRGRSQPIQLENPEQALILASIIEKETGQSGDRSAISAVFHNRLKLNMLLQTDPTVIYGLGSQFDGNLTRTHLLTDHPWNTYTRKGLPPTPIAMPGKLALQAAVAPMPNSRALYFVARGNGSSEFSETLAQHNAAVDRYQRKQKQNSKAQ